MKYRGLGRSGVRVSEIGLGTNQFGGTCDQATVTAIIDRAIGLGVNFIDSAESYAGRGEGAREWFAKMAVGLDVAIVRLLTPRPGDLAPVQTAMRAFAPNGTAQTARPVRR